MLPRFIENRADFDALIAFGQTEETLVLEFKRSVATKDPGAKLEVCRDVAQFANTYGGCLLIGIEEEKDPKSGAKRASSVYPVDDVDKTVQWLEQAIVNYLVPSTLSHRIVRIEMDRGPILSVNIPANLHVVALWDRQAKTIEYLRRTNHGKEWMNPDEMETHMLNGSRATRIALERAMNQLPNGTAEFCDGVYTHNSSPYNFAWCKVNTLEETCFIAEIRPPGSNVSSMKLRVPYSLVQHIWTDRDTIQLLLEARVEVRGSQGAFLVPRS
jgi:hypothetical protein